MKSWLLAISVAGALVAGCASNTAHDSGAGGSGGSSAGTAGSGGSSSTGGAGSVGGAGAAAGGGAAGTSSNGRGGAGGTSSNGGGGAAGTSSNGGGGAAGTSSSGGGGAAGTSSSGVGGAAGTSSGGRGGSGVAGQGGASGNAGGAGAAGGAAGAGGRLPDGTAQFDLLVTSGGQSNHITTCAPSNTVPNRLVTYPNGRRYGNIYCTPESQGPLYVYDVGLTVFPDAIGTHDAADLRITCDVLAGGCFGVGTVITLFKTGTANVEITSFGADSKSGTFTLDEFTADGYVSGSMDLTMSEGAYTVRITGRFKASLHDCGQITSPNIDPCTGSSG